MGYEDWTQLLPLPNPAAGASLVRKVPGETFEQPISFRYTLATSAVAANRFPGISFLDGDGATFLHVQSSVAVLASSTVNMNFFVTAGVMSFAASGDNIAVLPGILMPPGFQLRADVANIDAGDQISAAKLYVCRFPSAQWAASLGAVPYSPDQEQYRP